MEGSQTAPGQFAGNDSLESLGLIDPRSGSALPTQDWTPGRQAPTPDQLRDGRHTGQELESGGTDSLGGVPQQNQGQPGTDDVQYAQQARMQFQTRTAQIDGAAATAYAQMIQGGMDAQAAQVVVQVARQGAIAQAQLEADRMALLPAAKQTVASRIAQEFSLPNVKIDASEILSEGSVEAMRARARTLAETRRGQNYQTRQRAGVDRVERGAGPGTQIDYDNLSSTNLIKLGIARGQFS